MSEAPENKNYNISYTLHYKGADIGNSGWNSEEKAHHDIERRFWKRTLYVALGAAAISLVGAYVSGGQLSVARKQLLYTDRPWIKPIAWEEPSLSVDDFVGVSGNFKIKNIGKSPALNVVIKSKFFPRREPPEFTELPRVCRNIKWADDFVGNALFPDDTAVEYIHSGFPPVNMFIEDQIKNKKKLTAHEINMKPSANFTPALKDRYESLFVLAVCIQYEIYNDPRKHYTSYYYNISRKTKKSDWMDTQKTSFDLTILHNYKEQELEITKEDFVSSAD